MKCPVCKDITLLMMDKKGIEVDYCPDCRGVWLDRGELEKLMQSEKAYNQNNNYENDYNHNDKNSHFQNSSNQNQYNQKKKRSFLDMLDFGD